MFVLAGMAAAGHARTSLDTLRYSADIATTIEGTTYTDAQVIESKLPDGHRDVYLGSIPVGTDIDAHQQLGNADNLFSTSEPVALSGGLTAAPADVVRFNGSVYTLEFDASENGVPAGIDTDALSVHGTHLLLSFDSTVGLNAGALTVGAEDLVLFDGTQFSIFFDGSAAGLPPGSNLDAAQYLSDSASLLVSFDTGGRLGGIDFGDEDVLEYDPATQVWEMAFDASVELPQWTTADLDALSTASPVCGDHTVSEGEVCDDGNSLDGDCCDSLCQVAAPDGQPCNGDDNICTRPDTCQQGACVIGACAGGSACSFCGGTCVGDTADDCTCQ